MGKGPNERKKRGSGRAAVRGGARGAFVFPGSIAQQNQILQSWSSFSELSGLVFSEGIIGSPLYFWKLGLTPMQIVAFFLLLFAHFIFVGIGIGNSLKTLTQKRMFATILLLQYGMIVILSMVAVDYSRWIFMGNLTAVAFVYLYKDKRPVSYTHLESVSQRF